MLEIKYTRKQYLNKECTYKEYYQQFITPLVEYEVTFAKENWGLTLDSELDLWDRVAMLCNSHGVAKRMEAAGDYPTLAGLVCLAKTAYRKLFSKETNGKNISNSRTSAK